MRRREFIVTFDGASSSSPLAARAAAGKPKDRVPQRRFCVRPQPFNSEVSL
jgi:hypothetical protein